jgi:hypothetical protein
VVVVTGFLPSVNGLRFTNSWPSEADVIVPVPVYGEVAIGNGSNGLCGGMVFTILDVFSAGAPPLTDSQPASGTPLFKYIVGRLIGSFNVPDGIVRYFDWMIEPDADVNLWITTRRGVRSRTLLDEWPKNKADIDAQQPSPLGLVTVHSTSPGDLGKNHHVLAYAYDITGDQLTIQVYDPNTDPAQGDGVSIEVPMTGTAPITHNINIGNPVRGFFRVDYTRKDPSALEPA